MSAEAETVTTACNKTIKETLTLKSAPNFFKLSICFLWSGGIEGPVIRGLSA